MDTILLKIRTLTAAGYPPADILDVIEADLEAADEHRARDDDRREREHEADVLLRHGEACAPF